MAYIKTKIVTPDPRIFVREHNKALRAANESGAIEHHEKHMPDHFKVIGFFRYKFDKRTRAYTKRKMIKKGHGKPNVYTGNTRQEVLGFRTIRVTPKGARLLMRFSLKGGSGRFYVRRGMSLRQISSQVQMMRRVAELEAMTKIEHRAIMQVVRREYIDNVNKHIAAGGRVRKRKGS